MSQPDQSDQNPEHLRNILVRVARESGELDLARELSNTATIVKPARYAVPGQDGRATLVDQDDDADTYLWGDARIACKGKCGKHTHHDIYIEVEGLVAMKARTFAVCRDCLFEQPGEVMSGIGDIQPRRLERIAAEATQGDIARRRARNRAARQARKRNR